MKDYIHKNEIEKLIEWVVKYTCAVTNRDSGLTTQDDFGMVYKKPLLVKLANILKKEIKIEISEKKDR